MRKRMYKVKKILGFSLSLILAMMLSIASFAQDFPAVPNKLVNDYTNTLSAGQQMELEQKLLAFEDSTSIQIAVVVMTSTGEYEIADYGDRLAKKWAIGDKKYDNGILLLVALGDRAMTIRTGYGIEGSVPDVIAYRIIENEIKPAFRQGDYYSGINNGVDALISYTKGEYKADPKDNRYSTKDSGGVPIIFIIIVIFVIISLISRSGGGGKNGGGKVMNGRGSSDLFWWTLLNSLGRGGRDDDGFGGGGFGGGGFGGGFGSGGGFGGFGGGGFGGGGASGRW